MRYSFIALGAVLILSGCSNSASPSAPTAEETVSSPAALSNESTTAPMPSPERPGPTSFASTESTAEPSADSMGQPLAGLPDCNWKDLTFKPNGEGSAVHLNSLGKNEEETTYIALNETGQKCIIREVPNVTFYDSDNHVMDPSFGPSKPDDPLPWVLPETLAVNFYFGRIYPGDMCPKTGEYIHHIKLTFADGKVLTIPQINKYYACPRQKPPYKVTMHVNLIQ